MPAQNIENEVCEAQGSPKRVLWHFHIRALIRNDHPQTPAQNRVIFHVVRGRTCAYLSISAHICTYLTYLRASGESARIWRTCAYLSISAHICTYLAYLHVSGVSWRICTYLAYLFVSGVSARIWRAFAYLSKSVHICSYLAHLRVSEHVCTYLACLCVPARI
jgi:hypothetical protein